jgi:DNA mismatch repair protein MutS
MASTVYPTRWKLMATFDSFAGGWPFSDDGAARPSPSGPFYSVLFEHPDQAGDLRTDEPEYFADLNLDQVLAAMTHGRDEYELEPFFYSPLHDPDVVGYRQEVLRDLERPEVLGCVTGFAAAMRGMRDLLARAEKAHYELQQQSWFVDAVEVYCEAIRGLAEALSRHEPASRGLRSLCAYLVGYVSSEGFASLAGETKAVKAAVRGIRYRVRIQGPRVSVSRHEEQTDYNVGVLDTFARFRQGAVKSHLVSLRDDRELNHIEAQILERVARLHPDAFGARAEYCQRRRDFLDETVARFDREVQFYVGYLELIGASRAAGLPFSYPQVSAASKEIAAAATFDIALAIKLVSERREVVCNDFHLRGPERMFVVSGPNNGGKTTFARTLGQLHHLGALGLPVPGSEARLFLPDRIFTHFEREEDIETLRGKFEDELVRVRAILERATSSSVIVMNESFNSTTLHDALFVGSEVMRRILEHGCLGVYVTFVDEIASLSEETVSVVTEVVADNPAKRTFKVHRRPADGRAYAWAIAEKYGLTYDRLLERIGA